MSRIYRATTVSSQRYSLAEGIIADDRTGITYWIDIDGGTVGSNLAAPTLVHVDSTVGAVALAADGGLLVAGHRGLAVIDTNGVISYGPDLIPDHAGSRLNDGIVDPQGRFVIGIKQLVGPSTTEVLLRVSPDGAVETLRTGLTLSNGLAFSPDGGTLYHVDTMVKQISAHPYSASAEWDVNDWTLVLDEFTGHPDGITVDSDGNLWVAEYGAARVQQFSPAGELLDRVDIGTPEATCPGFIAPGLLGITSGREVARDAEAGAIYTCEVDAVGLPEHRWAGSTSAPYWK